jgi:hypothetical protein
MKSIIIFITFMTLVSCKGGGGGGSSSRSNLGFSSLIGNWMVDAQDATCEVADTVSYKPLYSFSEQDGGQVFLLGNFFYLNSNCSGTFVGLQGVGYTLSINQNDINFNYLNEVFAIYDSSFLAQANANSFCGINNWVLGEFKSIEGTACSGNPPLTFDWSDINVGDSTLSYKDTDGSTVTIYRSPEKNNLSSLSLKKDNHNMLDVLDVDNIINVENILIHHNINSNLK